MTEALGLEGGEKVLEIGAGSGYAAAILSEIAGEVYTGWGDPARAHEPETLQATAFLFGFVPPKIEISCILSLEQSTVVPLGVVSLTKRSRIAMTQCCCRVRSGNSQ